MNINTKNKIISIIMLLSVAMIWGFAFVAQTAVTESLGANSFTGIRFILGALTLMPVAITVEKGSGDREKSKRTLKYGVITGVVMYLACITQQYGIEITQSAGKAGFMTAFYTVLVPITSSIIYRQKKWLNVWAGAVIAMVGLFLLSINEALTIGFGEILLLLSAAFWTAQIILVDVAAQKDVNILRFSMIQFFMCGAVGTALGLVLEPESFTLTAIKGGLIPLLYAGILSVGVAFTLQTVAQKRSDPTTAAIIFSTESVFGTIGGALILKEVMSLRAYMGCLIMFVGLILSQLDMDAIVKRLKKKNKENI